MATETYYKVYCSNEQQFFTFWNKNIPINCPNDYRHKIDKSQTIKLETRNIDIQPVSIQQESVATNGMYRYKCIKFDCGSNGVSEHDIVFPYPITVLQAETQTNETHRGDKLDLFFLTSNNTLGTLSSNLNIGECDLYVDNSVINNMNNGLECIITDGSNTENLGEVVNIIPMSNLIHTEYNTSNVYNVETPTYIKYRMPIIEDMWISDPRTYTFGHKKITGTSLPASTYLKMYYSNSSPNSNKELIVSLEYMY